MRRDALVNLAGNIALAVLAIASGKVVSAWFGPSGRGVLGASQVAMALAATIGGLGLGDAVLYRRARGNHPSRTQVLRWAGAAAGAALVLGLGAGAVLGQWLRDDASLGGVVTLVAAASAATAFLTVAQGHTRGAGSFAAWNVVRVAGAFGWIVALAAARRSGGGVSLVVVASVYSLLLVALAVVPLRAVARRSSDDARLGELLRFGVPAALGAFPQTLNARVDQFTLAAVSSSTVVGYYAAAAGYCWAVVPLSQALANLLFTRVAATRDEESRRRVLESTVRLGVSAVLVSGLGAWLLAGWALPLLNTDEFGPAVRIARILLVGAVLQSVTFLLEEGTRGLGLPRIAMVAELVGLGTMGVLLALVARRGAEAVAWASVAGYAASFIAAVVGSSRATGTPWHRLVRPGAEGLRALVPARR